MTKSLNRLKGGVKGLPSRKDCPNKKRMRVLLVEDSPRLLSSIPTALRRSGFAVDATGNGEEGLWLAQSNPYDAAILDIMVPGLSGLEILRAMRREGLDTPVLLLTARDTVEDRVQGLEEGADDYLTKPFALEELLARTKALCRRRYNQRGSRVQIGNLTLDTSARTALVEGRPLALKPREYSLLEYLVRRRGSVVARAEIEEHIYDEQASPMSNVVDSAVCLVRRKLRQHGAHPVIRTRRGEGYLLEGE